MDENADNPYSSDPMYPLYERVPGFVSTVAQERAWYDEAERQWDLYQHLLSAEDKEEWYQLVPFLKLTQSAAEPMSKHRLAKVTCKTLTWAHVAMGRIMMGVEPFLRSEIGWKAMKKFPLADLRALPPNVNGPTILPPDVPLIELETENAPKSDTPNTLSISDSTLEGVEAPGPMRDLDGHFSEAKDHISTKIEQRQEVYETRTFDLKSPVKLDQNALYAQSSTPLARPKQYAQLAKFKHKTRGFSEEVKRVKSDLGVVKSNIAGLDSKCNEMIEVHRKDVALLTGKIDDFEGILVDLVEKGQQLESEFAIVKEWIVMFRDHLGLE